MPFYEYECPHCGYDEEVLQKISDKPLKKCPSCGKNGLRKLMSAPVFRLKGSGWYETDFKSDKENKRNLHGADKEDAAAKKDEAKPAEKAEGAKSGTAKPDAPASKTEAAKRSQPKQVKRTTRPKAKSRPARKARR